MISIVYSKICCHCKREKCLQEFCNRRDIPDGKNTICRQCVSGIRKRDKKKIRVRTQKWRKNNPEKYKLQRKRLEQKRKEFRKSKGCKSRIVLTPEQRIINRKISNRLSYQKHYYLYREGINAKKRQDRKNGKGKGKSYYNSEKQKEYRKKNHIKIIMQKKKQYLIRKERLCQLNVKNQTQLILAIKMLLAQTQRATQSNNQEALKMLKKKYEQLGTMLS